MKPKIPFFKKPNIRLILILIFLFGMCYLAISQPQPSNILPSKGRYIGPPVTADLEENIWMFASLIGLYLMYQIDKIRKHVE